jgi:hypothetical protein
LIYDPSNVAASGSNFVRQPIPAACNGGTCYPAGRYVLTIDPVAAKLLQFLPLPTASGATNNYSYSLGTVSSENQYNFRIDHNFSPNQRSFVRGTRDIDNYHQNDIFGKPTGPNAINQALTAYLFALGHTWTVSPTMLLQFTYGFAYQKNFQVPENFTGYDVRRIATNRQLHCGQLL